MSLVRLYHIGFAEIREPDVHYGRKNADFGQGFYLSDDRAFSERWATERRGSTTYLNIYDLETDGLKIKELVRGEEWYDYIFGNRRLKADPFADYDIIAGPIANDTIYNVMGITTSGLLDRSLSLKLLMAGPAYRQIALRTEKAAAHLRWLASEVIPSEKIAESRQIVRREEAAYQAELAKVIQEII